MSKLKYYDGTEWKTVNGQITGDTLPIGAIIPYGSTNAPANWLVCDGSAVSRTTYADLFNIIGTSFGIGDGSTTFNLPNLKGKVPVGQDANDTDFNTIGKTGGSKTHQLSANELTWHNHQVTLKSIEVQSGNGAWCTTYEESPAQANIWTMNSGDSRAFNILQPYQVSCFIIKVKQSAGLIANVSNTQSNSQTDTYSCDYINDIVKDIYSTDEIKTNKVDDSGRPIYRRVFNGDITAVGQWLPIPNSIIPNYRATHELRGIYGGYLPVPTYVNSTYSIAIEYNSSAGIEIFSLGFGSGTVKVTIEYTKTTD